jgi:hypothetical protein
MKHRIALLATALTLIASVASAGTIMQFSEVLPFSTPFSFTENGAGTQSNISGTKLMNVTFDPAFCAVVGCGGVSSSGIYNLTLNATSIIGSLALGPGTAVHEGFSGSFSFIGTGVNAGLNLLTVNFTDLLSGSIGGGNPTLESSQPPDIFSGSSAVFGSLGAPRGFSFGFSNLTGGLQVTGNSISGGKLADLAGTINATATVPEPTTMVLFGTGLLAVVRKLKVRQ